MPKRRQYELWGIDASCYLKRSSTRRIFNVSPFFKWCCCKIWSIWISNHTHSKRLWAPSDFVSHLFFALATISTGEFSQLTQKQRFYLIENLQSLSFLIKVSSWTRPALVLCTTTPTMSFQRIVALMEQKGELIGKWESNLQSF